MIYPYRPYTSMLPKQACYHKTPIQSTKAPRVSAAQVHDTEFASTSYVNYSSMAVYILFTASRLRIGVAGLGSRASQSFWADFGIRARGFSRSRVQST